MNHSSPSGCSRSFNTANGKQIKQILGITAKMLFCASIG
jgi:hypothetical protein